MEQKTYSVSQVNELIKNIIDNEAILENMQIEGELSSFSITRNIAYFNLKDNDSILNCVLFNADRFPEFRVGDYVIIRGSIKYYAKGGRLSFNAIFMQQAGQGKLYKQFLELKLKLENEGLFDKAFKKAMPEHIRKVGVISSRTGAVIQDIINVTSRRNPLLNIVLYDVQVQGKYAKEQIVKGIQFFSEYKDIDIIIVARGGGSIEDLQPFNEEEVARACFDCKKPVISAVGHETDFTIIDFVADFRAPTPSAAAELVSADIINIKEQMLNRLNVLANLLKSKLNIFGQQIEHTVLKLQKKTVSNIQDTILQTVGLETRLQSKLENTLQTSTYRVNLLINTLDKLNPIKLLNKGYSIISKNNLVVNDSKLLAINDDIEVQFYKGKVIASVKDIKE
ncbi:MAG: exodeoxyribonuclease VII large subunit [Clostridia bacterium]|nr:exodeoxyribonuclease VII large subunit [Clostridia bacterium]